MGESKSGAKSAEPHDRHPHPSLPPSRGKEFMARILSRSCDTRQRTIHEMLKYIHPSQPVEGEGTLSALRLDHGVALAAVNDDAGAGYEVCALGCEEGYEVADGFGPAESAEGQIAGDEVFDDLRRVFVLEAFP